MDRGGQAPRQGRHERSPHSSPTITDEIPLPDSIDSAWQERAGEAQ
jgi:hypothetical protein